MSVKSYARGSNTRLSKHFALAEFECKCQKCPETLIDSRMIPMLEKMRELLRCPLQVTSGYRCADYQEFLKQKGYETAAQKSSHEMGKAVDLRSPGVSGVELRDAAKAAGFPSIGEALTFIHVDIRGLDDGKERYWKYGRC